MSFFSDKTRIKNKITIFKAFSLLKTSFIGGNKFSLVLVLGLLFVGGYYTYAQVSESQRYVIETVHVFPEQITAEGWKNVDQIAIQNLSDVSLYQEFNSFNSAYIDVETHRKKVQNIEEIHDPAQQDQLEVGTDSQSSSTTTATTSDLPTDEDVPFETISTTDTEIQQDVEQVNEPPLENASSSVSDESVTALKKATDLFSLAFASVKDLFPFTQQTTTTTSQIATQEDVLTVSTSTDAIDEVTDDFNDIASDTVQHKPVELEIGDVADIETDISTSTDLTNVEDIATSTENSSVEVSTSTEESASTTPDVSEIQTIQDEVEYIDIAPCEDECIPYVITMNNFGLPIFDQTLRLGGGQLRVSFAAKRRSSRDEMQNLSVNYSFDKGAHWQSSGVVLIDDEASNSINGGYYLFSIPELTKPEDLDALSIEIRYQDDPLALEGIFLESAWLELFTIKAPDVRLLDTSELLADNGFDPEVLSGDRLVLEDGSHITFEHTDENNGETLIIKSDSTEYGGLSKTTTYFSVTNTSDKSDTFSLKTYFPNGLGEVTDLQQWNQNKEKKVVIPEYRPYAYYCEAGWEATTQPQVNSLQDISKLLIPDVLPVEESSTSTISTQINDESGSIDAASSKESVLLKKTATTTVIQDTDENVLGNITGSTTPELLQESEEVIAASSTAFREVDTEYLLTQAVISSSTNSTQQEEETTFEEDLENNYICRQTNIIRECDSIEGDNTSCVLENVKVQEHTLTRYEGGWEEVVVASGDLQEDGGVLKRAKAFFGFGPDKKPVPSSFEVRAHSPELYNIEPGETKYFKMDISFPMFSEGEFWIEAIGEREYGLLDPFWSSQWQYRIPILIDNTNGTSVLTQQQVYLQLDSTLSDFWSNVNADGSDIRFVQENTVGNLYTGTSSQFQNALGASWQDKITITIPAASVAAGVTDFPVFVDLATLGPAFWNGVASDGRDIRVTQNDGVTEVPLDIVEIDAVAKTGEMHFLANSLSASTDTKFHIYFNNPNVSAYASTSPLGSQAVWKNYEAVYHFSDDPTAITNVIIDHTGNGQELEVEGAALATTTGSMGTALDMTGTTVGVLRDVGNDFAWTAGDDLVSTGLYYQTINSAEAIWQFGTSSNPNWSAYMPWYVNASTTGRGYMYFGRNAWTEWARDISVWHHFTTIAPATPGDFHGIYDNAIAELSVTQTVSNPSNLGGLQIGRWTTAGSYNGLIDELRFAKNDDIFTSGWITTEHLNQTNPSSFYATSTGALVGGESVEGWFSTSWNKRQKISVDAQQSALVDFPVYVDLSTLGSDFFSSVASDGRDIRIVKSDQTTELPYELVSIDTVGKTGELYFKTDLGTESVTDFYIYFDNSDASAYARSDTYGSDNVWTNNYQAVYHLEEEAAGVGNVNVYKDSTANAYDGDDETVSTGQGGKLGAGQQFGTDQNDHLSLPKQAMDGLTDTTVSWWHNTTITGAQSIVSAASGSGGSSNEYLDYFANQTGFYMYNESLNNYFGLAYPMNDGVWHSFSSVRNASTSEVFFYYDGAPDSENPDSLVVDTINVASGGLIVGQDQDSVGGGFASNQNFEGQLDELRIASVVRDDQWIASEYRNQDTPTEFYATSSVETLQATDFSELDFWLQHFSTSTNEADIWVQVDSIPAGGQATIWMYYGNSGAQSASDEFAPFTFDTLTDTYYVVHGNTTTDIILYSLIDNNQVQVDGGTITALNAGESMIISGYASTSVIATLGPVTSRQNGAVEGEPIVPISFAASTHVALGNRNNPEQYHVYAPFGDASVSIYNGSAGAPSASGVVVSGSDNIFSFDIPSYTNAAVVESTQPVLLYNEGANINDSVISYPPTTKDLFGFHSNYWFISTADITTNYDVYCESGATGLGQTVTRGVQGGDNICPQASDAANNTSVRITGQTNPVTAMQQADSDGYESTIFLPEKEFGTEYYIPTAADYVAVICTPRFGTTTLEMYASGSGTPTETAICSPTATAPDSVRFANGGTGDTLAYSSGARIVSTNGVPFYVIYDDEPSAGDETNVWSAVQNRKYHDGEFQYSIGEQEIANDAQYQQLSFLWYQNDNVSTPTTTWEISPGEYVTEKDSITGSGAVDTGDVLRLRMSLLTSNATGTANATAFKLQYASAESGQCSTATAWIDVGSIGSTTAAFRGYDNTSVADGSTLATSTLASTTVLATYEERNLSNFLPTDVSIGDIAEWDWVIQTNQIEVNTNYCFRMVHAAGTPLVSYTTYPEVESVGPPGTPTPFLHFDNEKTAVTKSVLEFAATDIAGDEIDYEIEIDNDRYFGSPEVTRNSVANFLEFENLVTPADKAPFNSGARIRFNSPTDLATGTTYWWRVRASDPSGSATSSDWSTPLSFTVDDTVTVSQWHQTTGYQFSTDALSNVSTTTTQISVTSNPGKIISTPIDFDDASVGNAWGEITWNDTETSGEILYQVEYLQNGVWSLIPDDLIPGNILGTSTSPINILELDTNIYNEIRLVATLNGTALSIQDWTVTWGLRVETPTLGDLFDNEKTALTLPVFDFASFDPQNDDLEYEISWGTTYDFSGATTTHNSGTDIGFSNQSNGADLSPFNSGDTITYTTQPGEAFTNGQTYWWRVRAKDPSGGNSWSPWSEPDSFTIDTALTVSSWFQTTEDQFNQGELLGVVATSTGAVVMVEDIGEYGTATLTDNAWQTISTQNTYRNMVVVASPEYNVTNSNGRSPRVRNKTKNSFQIKVDNHTSNFVGSTDVSYVVMEAGTWNIADGAGGTQVVAGTEKSVSKELIRAYQTGYVTDVQIDFSPVFSTAPTAFATIASDNDTSWVMTHTDGCGVATEVLTNKACIFMAESTNTLADHQPEDIDYVFFGTIDGANNGTAVKAFNSPDTVTGNAVAVSYPSAFSTAPAFVMAYNNAEDGGDGGMGSVTTAGTHNASQTVLQISEFGPAAGGHTTEIVSVLAFESGSGIIKRDTASGALSGEIHGEDIIFTDGAGPKFDNFTFIDSTPGGSDIVYQLEYKVSQGVYALIPDTNIPGNSTGTSISPIDLTGVDIDTYGIIRPVATLTCASGVCPELQEWKLEWSEGVNMSGTLKQYDRTTNVATGTIKAAVNGVPVAGTGLVASGVWTLNNITAFAGDVITVWVDGAAESNEAVTVFVYDGSGDISNVALYEQHLAIDAGEKGTLTNTSLGSYDNSVSGNEDIFFDVDGLNNLTVCAVGTCSDANLYIAQGQTYIPATSSPATVITHDFINEGTIELDANTFQVSGSWINTATSSTDVSTIILTASTTDESITSTESPLDFHTLTFGGGSGTSTYSISAPLDLSGDLSVVSGTFDRGSYDITVEGNVATGLSGNWSGIGTTTFDGNASVIWSDAHASSSVQNIGNVVIDGVSKIVTITSDVRAYDITIGGNDTLSGGGTHTIFVQGDWTNTGTFLAETSTIEFVNDDRIYPPIIPGSADWYSDTNFVDRLPLVIHNAEVPSTQINFPVYVDLGTLGDDFWDSVKADGGDIRITQSDGQSEIPYEIVSIDTAAKTGELHFLAPNISGTTDTTFYLYHNNPSASGYSVIAPYGRNAVWAGYEAVYHFNDDVTSIGSIAIDASGKGKDLQITIAGLATSSGKLGIASDFNGSTGIMTDSDWSWTAGDIHVASGWYKMAAVSTEALWSWGTGSTFIYLPWYTGTTGYHRFGSSDGGTSYSYTPRSTNWTHFTTIAPTSTGQLMYVYDDAIERDSTPLQVDNPSSGPLQIGRYTTAGSIDAEFDELRFATSTRSSDWIETEYSNQNNPTIFYSTSTIQTYVPDVIVDEATHTITAGGSSFYNLIFNDATTSPSFADPSVIASGDFTIATGTISMPTGKMTIGGSFLNNGVFMHNNAEIEFNGSGANTITLGGTTYLNSLYDVTFAGAGSWVFADTNATTSNNFIINNGTVTFPSGVLSIGATLNTSSGGFVHNNGSVVFSPNGNQTVTTNGSSFNNVQFGDGTALSWYDIAWGYRTEVSIQAGTVSETLTDFPVYVNLGGFDDSFWDYVKADGADIRVTKQNGVTEVPVDVVEIDTVAKTGEMHFLADSISPSATTTFFVYFGNTDATTPLANDTYGSQNVWAGYEAVYHFNDGVSVVQDETMHGRDLNATLGIATTTTGLIGQAIDTTASSVRLDTTGWTWTAGENLISSGLYFMDAVDNGALWQFGVGSGSNDGTYMSFLPWYTGTETGYHQFGYTSAASYNFVRDNTVWHHFTTIGRAPDGSVSEIYDQNILRDSWTQITSSANPSNTNLRIGCYQNTTCTNIQIDELRIATTTPSLGRMTAEYNNLTDVNNFYATSTAKIRIDSVATYTLSESTVDADGDVNIVGVRVVAPSSNWTIGGSFTVNDSVFDANNGTVTMDSSVGAEIISVADNDVYNLSFNNAGGDWTTQGDITVTNDLSLVNGTQFTQATGTVITVQGIFSNAMGAVTTWTDSTLVLTGGDYTVTDKLSAGDTYAIMEVSADSDIVIWNSSISTSTIESGSSIYMPDFAGTDGLLRIYGDYERITGDEHWSYATDFDGTDLSGGSERAVSVNIENASQLTFASSSTLHIVGVPTASTTVSELFGLYEITLDGATLDVQYAQLTGMGVYGLHVTNGSTISRLSDAQFFVANGRSGITADVDTINAQPSSEYQRVYFATTTATNFYDVAWSDQMIVSVLADALNTPLSEFPVYVDLSTLGPAFWATVQPDGRDIRVTTQGADELPIDLVWINTTTQTGELYFLAPNLSSNKDSVFYIHYNNPSAVAYGPTDTFGTNAVWKNYEAVYHFNDGDSSAKDSTKFGRDLYTVYGTTATTTGLLGEAIDMTASNARMDSGAWTWTAGDDLISSGLYFMTNTDTGALWQFGVGGGSNNGTYLSFMPNYDLTNRGRNFFGMTSGAYYTVTGYDNTIWHHFTTIGRAGNGETNEIYEDGVLWNSVTQSATSQNPSNTTLKIGCYQNTTCSDIQVDELRFATTTPSNTWRDFERTNLTSPTSTYATSTEPSGFYNVTADGVPSTFWRFSNGSGDLYGEMHDNDEGDPGSIQWDDSNYGVTISGIVYADDGVTPMGAPVCNGSTEVVKVVIDGGASYTTSCDPRDGSYEVTGITYTGEPKITTYIESNATTSQVNVVISDEVTGSGNVAGTAITLSRPEVINGTVLVAIIGKDDDPAITAPAGWTTIATLGNTTGDDLYTGIWYKIITDAATEPSTYTFTTADNTEGFSYWMGSLMNVDTVTPVDVVGAWTKYQNQFTPDATAVTTVTDGALVLAAWHVFLDTDVTAPLSRWDVIADNIASGDNGGNMVVAARNYSLATTTDAVEIFNVAEGRESQAGQFAFRPAGTVTATGTVSSVTVTKTPLGSALHPYKDITLRDQKTGFASVANGATLSVDAPYMEDGDVLVAIIGKDDFYTTTAPAGWVLADDYAGSVGSRAYSGIWYKVVSSASTEPVTYSWTSNDTSAEEHMYWIGAFDNVDTANVFDITPNWSNDQNTSSPTAPSITTVSDGTYVLAAWMILYDNTMTMPGAPWKTLGEDLNISSRNLSVVGRSFSTAGATGDVSLTGGSTDDVNVGQFALRPEPLSVANSITDMDLYAQRVIVRHEDSAPITIADLSIFDNSDDTDIPYTVATGTPDTLTVLPQNGLMVWDTKTFTPDGIVNLSGIGSTPADGALLIGANSTYTATSSYALTVGGSFYGRNGATYNPASSTVTFTATSTGQQIGSAASTTFTFADIAFTGSGGGWAIQTPIISNAGIVVSNGTVSGVADVTVESGSFSGAGLVDLTGGTTLIKRTNTLGGAQAWSFNNLTLGDGVNADTTTPAGSATTTIRGTLTIAPSHFLDAGSSVWDLSGNGTVFIENGSFLEGTSLVRYSGTSENILRTNYYDLSIDAATGTVSVIAPSVGLSVLNDLTVGIYATSTLNLSLNNPTLAVGENILIGTKGTIVGSNTNTLEAYGSWDNNGVFTANGGSVEFKAATGTHTIAAGNSSFYDLLFTGTGLFDVTEHATATNNVTIGDFTSFTLDSGVSLAVGGVFTNPGFANTWTGSTLYLYGGQAYEINTKGQNDSYATLIVGTSTQPRVWDSSFVSTTIHASGSLYSMNHNGVSGDLYIFGEYVNSTYDDYWDYARDWDGSDLSGVERQANVYIEGVGKAKYIGGSLSVAGSSTASTTIQNQGSGTYELYVGSNASTSWQYAIPRNLTVDGIVFTGDAIVDRFDNLDLLAELNNAQVLTVGGSVIDVNPAKNFDLDIFNVAGGVTGAKNVTATGTSVSSWRFTNHTGNLDGEALDNDGGDPGEIVWIDSAALITISGHVYSDEGTTASAFCDGVTNNITIMVAGLTAYNTSCDASGAYAIPNIGFGPSDSIIAYINGEVQKGATITTDPISNIANMDIYENRVIVRHESTDQVRIADLAVWDSSDDVDIPFTAVDAGTDTLTLPADTKLIVWTNKEFAPAGNVTLSGGGTGVSYDGTLELYDGATWTSSGAESHSIGGSLISGIGATFEAALSTTTFTSSGAGRTVDINEDDFHNLVFSGTGSWTIADDTLDANNIIISGGTLTLPTATTTVSGAFNTNAGSFIHNGTVLVLNGSDTNMTVAFNGSDIDALQFSGTGSWNMTDTNATATASVLITSGSVSLPSGIFAINGSFRNEGGTVIHNTSELVLYAAGSTTLLANGSDLGSLTYNGSGDLIIEDTNVTLAGSLSINTGTATVASGTLAIGGSLDAIGGVLNHASGTILFNSSNTGETVAMGSNDFYNVIFGSALGGWTITGNATATNNFTLSAASNFTLQSGSTLDVQGVFTNLVGGAATVWNGTTLVLDSGTTYEINTKVSPGDTYNILTVPTGTNISMWNSEANSISVTASSSVYSQDHAATDGSLAIFGAYTIATSSEYWSYATDFDGAALGAGSRQVQVSFATTSSSSVLMTGGSLDIIGIPTATTTIQSMGSGEYAMQISGGTFNTSYYDFKNQDSTGLLLTGTPSITSLSNGAFTQSKDNAVSITLTSDALNNNASLIINKTNFTNGGFVGGVNVSLDATTTASWSFTEHTGNLSGEAFDIDGTDDCSSIRWDDSNCLLTEQTHYRWRNDDGGEGAIASTWFDDAWGARKRVRIVNNDTTTYGATAVKIDVVYDADMQTDFDDIRFTDNSGTTTIPYWIEKYSVGASAEVWVQVPSLASESTTEVFMYYNHNTATTTSSSTQTFAVADDFDDGNIVEYSGDTGLFTAGGSFAYGGGFGLDTSGNEGARATDGIFRSDVTVSQGDIIRYRQYIDTGAGASDEACTLFGVQNPGTNNFNYGVCLEQFGVDRISLVKDAESTDTYGAVTVLASTTVAYTTGWYSVEIDWQTDNTIAVTLFDVSNTVVATTTATDSTYTSGGIGFTYWGQNGGWDSYTAQSRTQTTPKAYFGAEQTKGGATWAAPEDTAVGGFAFGDTIRLRMAIENSGLPITNQQFALEFAPKLTAPSCEAVSSGNFTAVPTVSGCGSSAVCMTASTTLTNGVATTDHLLVGALEYTPGEVVIDPSNKTTTLNLDQGKYTELEYALNLTTNAVNDAYCFRATNDGTPLDSYASIAELTLAFDPTMDTVIFNGGNDITLTPGATTTVIATTTVTDFNGYTDLVAASSTFYTTSAGAACVSDDNNCYKTTTAGQCTFSECSGNSCLLTCTADMQYHADPTDVNGEDWYAFLEVNDIAGGYDFGTSLGVDLLTLRAMSVDNAIGYGTVDLNSDTGAFNPVTTLVNQGNESIDIEIVGTDMTDGGVSVVGVNNQKYATSTFTYSSCTYCSLLDVVNTAVEVDLFKPTTATPPIEDFIYWGIHVPSGTNSAPHTGHNTFYVIGD